GEQLTLRVGARHATHSNFGGKPEEWAHKTEVLKGHCAAVGRDYDEITKTWSPEVFIRETEAAVAAAGSKSFWGEPVDSWTAGNLVGTPEQVAEKIQTYVDLGCTGFIPWCSDYPDTESLRLLGSKVIPALR
ncbi:MAG: LLM class flavin-dependent oxidoreductase, partial [Acidimicrobiia bacterium]